MCPLARVCSAINCSIRPLLFSPDNQFSPDTPLRVCKGQPCSTVQLSKAVQYIQCNAVPCSAVQLSKAVQYIQCSESVQYSGVQYITVQYSAVQYMTV